MPIYEYECTSCHHQFELLQKVSDEPATQCPACTQATAVRLVSAPGFQLKGTGWYVTDFKDKGKKETKTDSEKSTAKEAPAAEKSEKKSEASPAKTVKQGESD